jgi:hypothetical protein
MEELGCGTAGHDPACLCDVVITDPLPPLRECFRDAVQELGMGARVAEVRGYGIPWTDETILDFLCDVQKFWDAWHERLENGNYSQLSDVPPVKWDASMRDFQKWGMVRDAVMFCMNRFDHSLVTILGHLDVSADMFMLSATQGKSGVGWKMSTLDWLDKEMMSENLVMTEVGEKFSLTAHTIRGLRKYWEERRDRMTNGVDNPARALMQRLCRDTDYPPSKIVEMVKEAHGITYARSSVSKCRERLRKKART